MILDLVKRGFLPKDIENDPAIVESIMGEQSNSSVQKQRSLEASDGAATDMISNPSPELNRLHQTRSQGDGKSSAFLLKGSGSS